MATLQFFNERANAYQKIQIFKTKRAKIGAIKKKNPTEPFAGIPLV